MTWWIPSHCRQKSLWKNDACIGDLYQMTSPNHIFSHLYSSSWFSVVDASKYFHMFCTQFDEQKKLGIIHPGIGVMYVYNHFPMGTHNSPGASGLFGAAFVCHVFYSSLVFNNYPVDDSVQYYSSNVPITQILERTKFSLDQAPPRLP